jgi:hypothetical protein
VSLEGMPRSSPTDQREHGEPDQKRAKNPQCRKPGLSAYLSDRTCLQDGNRFDRNASYRQLVLDLLALKIRIYRAYRKPISSLIYVAEDHIINVEYIASRDVPIVKLLECVSCDVFRCTGRVEVTPH